ncbi:SIR2-like protein [Nocardioides sp. SLBN-35]|nr:SIR2-like protein [Nocardioides sp. SLBN-35]
MPEGMSESALRRDVVIFAGAGISTEVSTVFPDTVLELAADRLGMPMESVESFPQTLEEYQNRFGRTELVRMIRRKFDFIDSFRSPHYHATRFHAELATMPYLRDIVTTNWDTYFEDECAATPFVSGADIALWEMPGRRVLKIHGSITNLASLVATESDYAKRLESLASDVMGGLLRQLLATKTVVFIGYSLRDWNFRRLYEALLADMKDFAPTAYVVSPHAVEAENDLGMKVIKTSGINFLRELKKSLVGHCVIDDEVYGHVADLYDMAVSADPREWEEPIRHAEYPAVIYTWFYNDGLRDICDRILRKRASGEYSDRHHVTNMLKFYDEAYERAYESGRYGDAAYIDGYSNGLILMLGDAWGTAQLDDEDGTSKSLLESCPLYFVYGADSDMRTREEFLEALEHSKRRSPKTRALARKIVEGLADDMILTHAPFIGDGHLANA